MFVDTDSITSMGKLEKEIKKQVRRTRINSAIIATLSVAGILAVGVIAPNVIGVLGKMGLINRVQRRQNVKRSLTRLIEKGYVVVEDGKARLTPKGETFAVFLKEGSVAIKKPKRWDGKWRIIIFDIPEKKKYKREQIRMMLADLGCTRLQDSVWVYPYDLEDIVTLLKTELYVGKNLLYIIADKIENDSSLRTHFSLR